MSQDGMRCPDSTATPSRWRGSRDFDVGRGADVQHAMLHVLPVAVYTTDVAGHITFYNEAAAALWARVQR